MITDVVIDPLKIYQRLKAAKVEEKAAKEIAAIFRDVLENQLATKKDIANIQKDIALLQKDLELKIEQSKNDTLKWVLGFLVVQTGILITGI